MFEIISKKPDQITFTTKDNTITIDLSEYTIEAEENIMQE